MLRQSRVHLPAVARARPASVIRALNRTLARPGVSAPALVVQEGMLKGWCRAVVQAFGARPGIVAALDSQLRLRPGSCWAQLFGNITAAQTFTSRPGLATQAQLQASLLHWGWAAVLLPPAGCLPLPTLHDHPGSIARRLLDANLLGCSQGLAHKMHLPGAPGCLAIHM